MIPTRGDCLRIMKKEGMLNNIMEHSLMVTKVALFLSRELNRNGERIDLAVVEAASMLHDVAKTKCLNTKEDHAEAAFRLLSNLGYERVAEVVSQHIHVFMERDSPSVSEEEVVNYADKRVLHDRIVSLKERFSDLRQRYGHRRRAMDEMDAMESSSFAIEEKIFSLSGGDPADLEKLQDMAE